MPRLFTGLELPEVVAQQLGMLRGGIAGARWIEPEDFHITLRYVGDVSAAQADDFASRLQAVRGQPFSLLLRGLASFGGRRPRALYAQVADSAPLVRLQGAHELAATQAGLPPQGRKFTPHVTLARLRQVSSAEIAGYLDQYSGFLSAPFLVTRFVLYSARVSTGGGPYVKEAVYPLAG